MAAAKVFMVIYVAGKIGGSVGPLPYDFKECLARRLSPISDLTTAQRNDLSFIHHGIRMVKDGHEVRIICEEWTARPPIDPALADQP